MAGGGGGIEVKELDTSGITELAFIMLGEMCCLP